MRELTEVNNHFRELTDFVITTQLERGDFVYNLQLIEDRIVTLAKEKNLSKNKLLLNAGLTKSLFDNMKKGQIPSVEKIHIIADYLNCSVDYLLGRTDNSNINK